MRVRFFPLLTLLGLLAPLPAGAEPLRHRADFDIQLAGLPFAEASFNSFRDDNLYEIEVNFRSAGVGQVVNDMTAELVSTGVIADGGLQSERYYLQYRKGERHRRFEAEFRDGDVVATRKVEAAQLDSGDGRRLEVGHRPAGWTDPAGIGRQPVQATDPGLRRGEPA